MIELGSTYRDKITGFTGVATGYVQYITGCNQALLVQRCGADGAPRDPQWFDIQRLEICASVAVITIFNGATPGCDRAAPKR
jgi:hypothetical protein